MAWVEKQGRDWRVRWYEGGRSRAKGGFVCHEEAVAYASGLDGGEQPSEADPGVTLGARATELDRAGCAVAPVRSVSSAMPTDAVGEGLILVNPAECRPQREPSQRGQERRVAQDRRQPVWTAPYGR